ncbi:VWA domain-containing protein, partial [Vicingaceae bacterium]|nr:VWA domain-containing protein [Vicingaceae bacterium]
DGTTDIEFGTSTREDNGYGRYVFELGDRDNIRAGTEQATSIRITGDRSAESLSGPINLLFRGYSPFGTYKPRINAITTQVDRDIALVLDRSGSMAYYENEEELYDEVRALYDAGTITYDEWEWTQKHLYDRYYYENVRSQLSAKVAAYAYGLNSYNYSNDSGPPNSRWSALDAAVDAFLDVLDGTDQEERVSLATFASSARLDIDLSDDFNQVRSTVSNIRPYGATAVGQGMEEGLPAIIGSLGRPWAAKTIVVLTDGQNNKWPEPVDVARDIVDAYNVTIHTVTFSDGAAKTEMAEVAAVGGGKHYHADNVDELIDIFEEIANNLPTVITK